MNFSQCHKKKWFDPELDSENYRGKACGKVQHLNVEWDPDDERKKEERRIDGITTDLGDIVIILDDGNQISLPRALFSHSPVIQLHVKNQSEKPVFLTFKMTYLSIDTDIISRLLLEKDIEIQNEKLGDYFMFFKSLNLQKEMKHITLKLRSINSFETFFHLFEDFITRFENDSIKMLFDKDSEDLDYNFKHSFSLELFNRMKSLKGQVVEEKTIFKRAGFLKYYFFHSSDKYFSVHDDYTMANLDTKTIEYRLQHLYTNRKWTNLTLKTPDGGCFAVHEEVLRWKSEYFHKLLTFGGLETKNKTNCREVLVDDFGEKALESYLEYIYLNKITTRKTEVLLPLLYQMGKYLMMKEFGFLLDILKECMANTSVQEIENVILLFAFFFCEGRRMGRSTQSDVTIESEEEHEDQDSTTFMGKYFRHLCCRKEGVTRNWVDKRIERAIEIGEREYYIYLIEEKLKKASDFEISSEFFCSYRRMEFIDLERKRLELEERERILFVKEISSKRKKEEHKIREQKLEVMGEELREKERILLVREESTERIERMHKLEEKEMRQREHTWLKERTQQLERIKVYRKKLKGRMLRNGKSDDKKRLRF